MEIVVNESLRELIEYELLSVSSFKNKMCIKCGVKIKHYGNNKCSLKHTLDTYIASLLEKYQRNTRIKLASALLFCLQCSHRKDFATLNICWLI